MRNRLAACLSVVGATFFFAVAFTFLVADDASAHGGSWRSPPSRGPAGSGGGHRRNPGKHPKTEPGDPGPETPPETPPDAPTTPPEGPSTPPAPPADAPTTPPAAPKTLGPTTTGAGKPAAPTAKPGGPGGQSAPNGPATGGRASAPTVGRRATNSTDHWETWWSYTRELYLGRHAGAGVLPTTKLPSGDARTGSDPANGSARLPDSVRRDLLAVLARALRDESTEVADSAAIALGRSVTASEVDPILPLVTRNLAHSASSPQEAAVLALGILSGPAATEQLKQIALDTPAGRVLCRESGPLDEMLRGLAALALGLVGTQDSMAPLIALATAPTTSRELAAAAVAGLGLQREAAPTAVVALAKLLDERALDREVRAQVPTAIARLPSSCARGMLPKLLATLADKRTCNEIARSVALALGHILTADDDDALRALVDVARRHDDASTRQFALLALGRVFERSPWSGAGTASAKIHDDVHAFLLDQLEDPAQRTQRPWAALALGLFGRGDATSGSAAPSPMVALSARRMIDAFEDASDPSLQGALAIGMGLLRAPAAATVLRARLASSANPGLRGHLALALGLLGDQAAIEPMRRLLADPSLPPSTRIDVARGLALTGDSTFEARLLDLLARADDVPSAVAYSKALGLVGSRVSADSLRKMAEDSTLPEIQRSFAIVAIGLLAEKTPLPWNVPFLVDANYTVPLRPLEEVLDLL